MPANYNQRESRIIIEINATHTYWIWDQYFVRKLRDRYIFIFFSLIHSKYTLDRI